MAFKKISTLRNELKNAVKSAKSMQTRAFKENRMPDINFPQLSDGRTRADISRDLYKIDKFKDSLRTGKARKEIEKGRNIGRRIKDNAKVKEERSQTVKSVNTLLNNVKGRINEMKERNMDYAKQYKDMTRLLEDLKLNGVNKLTVNDKFQLRSLKRMEKELGVIDKPIDMDKAEKDYRRRMDSLKDTMMKYQGKRSEELLLADITDEMAEKFAKETFAGSKQFNDPRYSRENMPLYIEAAVSGKSFESVLKEKQARDANHKKLIASNSGMVSRNRGRR